MNKTILSALMLSSIVACSTNSKLIREGYTITEVQNEDIKGCQVFITNKNDKSFADAKKFGSVKASDPGMGVNCQEDYVIGKFISDACALKANVINITSESQPNFWSTCYRAKADLLSVNDIKSLKTNPKYLPKLISERSKKGHQKTKAAMSAGAMGGLFGAIVTN